MTTKTFMQILSVSISNNSTNFHQKVSLVQITRWENCKSSSPFLYLLQTAVQQSNKKFQ